MKYTPEEVKKKLTEAGLKATQQRIVIYACLLADEGHPTADKIYDKIKVKNPSISLGTVYKTLDSFAETGLVKRVNTGEDVYRFDAKIHGHDHLFDTKTNRIIDYEDNELHSLLEDYFARKNIQDFKITGFQVNITGEITEKNTIKNK